MEMRTAVAAGSAVGLSIAFVGAIAFMLGPKPAESAGLVGLVCWTAAIAVAVPAVALAPLGVTASHSLGTPNLKRAFGAVMLLASVITVWKVFF